MKRWDIAHALSNLGSHLQSTLLFHKWHIWHKWNLLAMKIGLEKSSTYHCSCSCLVHLVLSCLDFGLQVCRGMKVLAFLPRASTFDVIHANCNSIFICVYHCNIYRVSIAAIILTTCAISTLKLSTNLKRKSHCWAEHQVILQFQHRVSVQLATLNHVCILNPYSSWVAHTPTVTGATHNSSRY